MPEPWQPRRADDPRSTIHDRQFEQGASHESRVTSHYDVVVAGASFAGLAVAQRLCPASNGTGLKTWRVLLLDKDPLGAGQTSACGAPVSIVRMMGAEDSILQVHHELVIHTSTHRVVWPLDEPFCTFDYRRFCELAFARTGAEFWPVAATGRDGAVVHTAYGDVKGQLLVDGTGWRAALVGGPSLRPRSGQGSPYVSRRWMAFGIESEVACQFDPGLHFYFLPEVRDGYAWAFPSGEGVRFGVLSYLGRTKLLAALERFMARFGLSPGEIHGGYLASGLRPLVVDEVFVVGDASGHCLPLTGEGIRTAVLAGFACGSLLQQVLDGQLSPTRAAARYRRYIFENRWKFRALLWGNGLLLLMPLAVIRRIAALLAKPALLRWFMLYYFGIFRMPPELPSALELQDA